MCGILSYCGVKTVDINRNIMPQRGPDSWGKFEIKSKTDSIIMFQSRLSIIGLGEQGKQPFHKDKDYVLAYNGEIYNYQNIRENLKKEFNIRFSTETDTEVLYYGLIYWGIDKMLNEINGIFAFCFYDKIQNCFWVARDNLGVKPLYYYYKDNEFAVSSECKAFFQLNICEPKIRRELLGEYFANLWVYEPNTLFENIYKLEAGCYMLFDVERKELTKKRYWSLEKKIKDKPNIAEIIKLQMVTSNVKVGAYLSGGIDSSIIAAALENSNISFLNLDLGGEENRRLQKLKELFNIEVITKQPDINSLNFYESLVEQMEEPIADPAIIPSYELARDAKRLGCTVMLSGMGGDEIDSGYLRMRVLRWTWLLKLFRLIPKKIIRIFLHNKQYAYYNRLMNFLSDACPSNFFTISGYFSKTEVSDLVQYNWYDEYKKRIEALIGTERGLKRYYKLDFKGFLASHNTLYSDKSSMATSVEVRVPLLDKDIVNYFYQDIHRWKNAKKRRLRKELIKFIGKENYSVKKEGFSYPIEDYIKKVNWQNVIAIFEDRKLLNTSFIKNLLKTIDSDKSTIMKLWTIYTLYLWIKVFNLR
jgi:asparagine synthase (glutamine-hydrolysing)